MRGERWELEVGGERWKVRRVMKEYIHKMWCIYMSKQHYGVPCVSCVPCVPALRSPAFMRCVLREGAQGLLIVIVHLLFNLDLSYD